MAPYIVRPPAIKISGPLTDLDPRPARHDPLTPARTSAATTRVSMQPEVRTCSRCHEEPDLQGLPYRIVLRCTHGDA